MAELILGRIVVAGDAEGAVLVSTEPLSFWGGYDPATGEIIDRRHPLSGQIAAGRVLALPNTIGSSTTTAVLLEAVRRGTAPAAILTIEVDSFLALAAIVAQEMYQRTFPILALTADQWTRLRTDSRVRVSLDGSVQEVSRASC
jgi:predicted aconitase with swiveling domain